MNNNQDSVLDSMSDEISLDITNLIQNNNTGNFSLPEDSSGEDYYFLNIFDYEFSVDIDITINNSIKNYDVDFELYFDEQEIYVVVLLNENYTIDENSDLYYDLIEGIRHELEHIKQYLGGFKRKKEVMKEIFIVVFICVFCLSCSNKKENKDTEKVIEITFTNPILNGFYPDPSICKVDNSYYLINSTFVYFPGIPVFKSDDLVNWKQIGNALDRPEQLDLEGLEVSRGVFAPAIFYHNGMFYIINTIVS